MREDGLDLKTRSLLFFTMIVGVLILLFLGWWLGTPWTSGKTIRDVNEWQRTLSRPASFVPALLWLFLAAVVLVRWNNVVRPTRQLVRVAYQALILKSQVIASNLNVEMKLVPIPPAPVPLLFPLLAVIPVGAAPTQQWQFSFSLATPAAAPPPALLANLVASVSALPNLQEVLTCGYWDFLLWSRGRELRVWRSIHSAERFLIGVQDQPLLQAGLTNVLQELDSNMPAENQHKIDIQALLIKAAAPNPGASLVDQMRLYLQIAWG
jgi:hypothetical protein